MPPLIELDQHVRDGVPVLRLQGEVDLTTSPRVREELVSLLGRAEGAVVVDLEGVDFMDSTGLSALVAGYNLAEREGSTLVISCQSDQRIRKLFDITGLARVITIRQTLDEAVACAQRS